MTYLEEYFTALTDGKIPACEKMKLVSEKILEDLYNPGQYHFDEEIASRHIDFIEKFCKVPSGNVGAPLKLELFQKARLQAIFGFVDDNNLRKYNEVLIVEGRKNGKTTECAAVEIDMLIDDEEGAPQIYNVATQREQATLGFNACHKMVKQSELLSRHIKKRAVDLYCKMNYGYIKALASNTTSLDGLDIHMATIDELSAIKNRDLYDLIKQAMGARRQPLLFCITTNGFIRNGIFDSQYQYASDILYGKAKNERFLPFIYELDSVDEWDKEECWEKANPGLNTIKSKEYLSQMVLKAKDDISFKPTVLVKDFNMPQNRASSWLKWEEIENHTRIPDDANFRYCIGGMDAADSIDLNAAKALCMRPGDEHIYLKQMYWMPQEAIDRFENSGKRQGRDNVPYALWKDQGYLRTVPGNKVNKQVFLDWFCELRDEEDLYTLYIGYDPWHIDDSLLARFKQEFGERSMIPVRQGTKTLSDPMKEMRADMKSDLIVHNENPIDKWCLANMEVVTDINGNIQPVKGLDARNRIDGGMALIDGYIVLKNKYDEYLSVI
ncbi:MAG: terminase TerL endonuclease subunit [Emergencia sp.]|nr:terminase TerL endonuclease subunit [Emergencia sp.]